MLQRLFIISVSSPKVVVVMMMMMMMMMKMLIMMVLCLRAGSLTFTPPGDEMSEVVPQCLSHRQLWVSTEQRVQGYYVQWLLKGRFKPATL